MAGELIPGGGRRVLLVAAGFSLRLHRRDAWATGLIALETSAKVSIAFIFNQNAA
jgi:hypothetical protein